MAKSYETLLDPAKKHYKTDNVTHTKFTYDATQESTILLHVLLIPAARPFTNFDSLLLERLVVIQHVSPAHLGLFWLAF